MKTTVDIPDSLLEETKRVAARDKTTVRALIEHGLRQVLAERKRVRGFHLRNASFKGQGLQPNLEGVTWDQIRDLAYEGHGA
jgi:hypothetical protein